MNKAVKYSIFSILVAAFCFGTAFLAFKSDMEYSMITCNSLSIEYRDSLKFLSKDEVKEQILRQYGNYIGQKLDSVKLYKIEQLLEKSSTVVESQAWTTPDGVLHVSISQRAPVLRFSNGDTGFYVDAQAYIFPLHTKYTADVPCLEGPAPIHIPNGYKGMAKTEEERCWLEGIIELVTYIENSRTLKDEINNLYINQGGDLILKLKRGDELFIFGGYNNYAEKLSKIQQYYDFIVPNVGDNYYKIVNLKYNKQIICRQKDI